MIDRGYGRMLGWALHHRAVMLAIAAVVVASAALLYPRVGKELVPDDDQGDFSRLPVGLETIRGLAKGRGLPWSRSSRGFWSKVSTWLGPPCRKTKMTLLARAGKGGE